MQCHHLTNVRRACLAVPQKGGKLFVLQFAVIIRVVFCNQNFGLHVRKTDFPENRFRLGNRYRPVLVFVEFDEHLPNLFRPGTTNTSSKSQSPPCRFSCSLNYVCCSFEFVLLYVRRFVLSLNLFVYLFRAQFHLFPRSV